MEFCVELYREQAGRLHRRPHGATLFGGTHARVARGARPQNGALVSIVLCLRCRQHGRPASAASAGRLGAPLALFLAPREHHHGAAAVQVGPASPSTPWQGAATAQPWWWAPCVRFDRWNC